MSDPKLIAAAEKILAELSEFVAYEFDGILDIIRQAGYSGGFHEASFTRIGSAYEELKREVSEAKRGQK